MGFYREILLNYGPHAHKIISNWNKTTEKLASFNNRKIFLLKCRSTGTTPTHIEDSVSPLHTLQTENHPYHQEILNINSNLKKKILNLEIKITFWKINSLYKELFKIKREASSLIPLHIYQNFDNNQRNKYEQLFNKIKTSQVNKFNNLQTLCEDTIPKAEDSWIVNLTNLNLPDDIKNILALGPTFCFNNKLTKKSLIELTTDCEFIINNQERNEEEKSILRSDIVRLIKNFNIKEDKKKENNNILKLVKKTQNFFKKHPEVIITRSDKGNKTVLINKQDYEEKLLTLIEDPTVYIKLNSDPTSKYQTENNNLINSLVNRHIIDKDTGKNLRTYNSVSPKIYGLPKIHKDDPKKLRPVVSCIGSPTYYISKFLVKILNNLIPHFQFNISDSFSFVEFLKTIKIPSHYKLISLDVTSMFTNVSKDLVLEALNENWEILENYTNVTKKDIVKITEFCFNTGYFSYNNSYYKQKSGTAMGSPSSPIFATMVMNLLLNKFFKEINFIIPLLKIYVDDIIISIPENCETEILKIFNNLDKENHIKFTMEQEISGKINFLDLTLIRQNDGTIITDWYQKPFASNRYINYKSSQSKLYKINTIKMLKHRVLKLSNTKFHNKNFKIIKHILYKNGYPEDVMNNILYTQSQNQVNNIDQNSETPLNTKYFKIPFIPSLSNKLIHFLKMENYKIVCYNNKNFNSLLFTKIKDKIPLKFKSNVIYKINCKNCSGVYIGQTKQWLKSRLSGHKSNCKNIVNFNKTALSMHHFEKGHNFDFENVKILDNNQNKEKRNFLEMLHIKTTPNTVNFRTDTQNLSKFYLNLFK